MTTELSVALSLGVAVVTAILGAHVQTYVNAKKHQDERAHMLRERQRDAGVGWLSAYFDGGQARTVLVATIKSVAAVPGTEIGNRQLADANASLLAARARLNHASSVLLFCCDDSQVRDEVLTILGALDAAWIAAMVGELSESEPAIHQRMAALLHQLLGLSGVIPAPTSDPPAAAPPSPGSPATP